MVFRTKIITGRKNPKATVAIAGALSLVLAVCVLRVHGYERYTLSGFRVTVFSLSAILLAGGVLWARGGLTSIMVSVTDLVVSSSDIRIGTAVYPLGQVTQLDFLVEGYDGMQGPDCDLPTEGVLNGTMNYVYFVFHGREVRCRFYLPDEGRMRELGRIYKELYEAGVPFLERGRAFLFEPVVGG